MPFSFFQFSNDYCSTVLLRHKYFWSSHFWERNSSPFEFFWNLHRNVFCFCIFSRWKKHYNLFLMTHLKCAVVHYSNINSSSISKPFLNYGPLNMLFIYLFIFDFLFTFVLTRLLSKKLWFFNAIFQNSFQDIVYYKISGCQTLWY